MKHRVILLIFLMTGIWSPAGFAQTVVQTPKPGAAAQAPDDEPPVLAVPRNYRYDSRGRRDPFVNPVPKPSAGKPGSPAAVRPPGLPGVLVSEAGIAGVVTSKEQSMNVAIITAPAGKMYFAHLGDELFDAVVKEIHLDAVTFVVKNGSSGGATPQREIVRKVHTAPGDQK